MSEELVAWARDTFPAPVDLGPVTTEMRAKIRAMADRMEKLQQENDSLGRQVVDACARANYFAGRAGFPHYMNPQVIGLYENGTLKPLTVLGTRLFCGRVDIRVAMP